MGNKKDHIARSGYIIFRRTSEMVHPIFWSSRRLKRVARSSATAEILASAEAADKGYYLSKLAEELTHHHDLSLLTDSRSLFQLIASNKEPEESTNKIDLAVMRSLFEDGSISRVSWMPGSYLIADALTKDNRETAALLNKVLRNGIYPYHSDIIERITPKGCVSNDEFKGSSLESLESLQNEGQLSIDEFSDLVLH